MSNQATTHSKWANTKKNNLFRALSKSDSSATTMDLDQQECNANDRNNALEWNMNTHPESRSSRCTFTSKKALMIDDDWSQIWSSWYTIINLSSLSSLYHQVLNWIRGMVNTCPLSWILKWCLAVCLFVCLLACSFVCLILFVCSSLFWMP